MNINLNKHIAILFHPRSGSTVLRFYLSGALKYENIGEFFNSKLPSYLIKINGSSLSFTDRADKPFVDDAEFVTEANGNLRILSELTEKKIFSVFGVNVLPTFESYPNLLSLLDSRDDIQFIRLERADVLYSMLSILVAHLTTVWHIPPNESLPSFEREITPFVIDLDWLHNHLMMFIKAKTVMNNQLADRVSTVYYEQFQNSPSNLTRIFTGIPRRLTSIPIPFKGQYKSYIQNLDEVENLYEQFVNDHKEFFPQYFGGCPQVQLPLSQGKQPRDLSLIDKGLLMI